MSTAVTTAEDALALAESFLDTGTHYLLVAMIELRCLPGAAGKTQDAISCRAQCSTAKLMSKEWGTLRRLGLVRSTLGRRGGTTLTQRGLEVARCLADRDQ